MFSHNFKYSIKALLGKKSLIFWTLIFPILLGTFFNMAFFNIEKKETFSSVDVDDDDDDSDLPPILRKRVF